MTGGSEARKRSAIAEQGVGMGRILGDMSGKIWRLSAAKCSDFAAGNGFLEVTLSFSTPESMILHRPKYAQSNSTQMIKYRTCLLQIRGINPLGN